jgi:hypothetical protein
MKFDIKIDQQKSKNYDFICQHSFSKTKLILNNDRLNNFRNISDEDHQIDFPVSYQLKVILDTHKTEEIHLRNLEPVLEDAHVSHKFVKSLNPQTVINKNR